MADAASATSHTGSTRSSSETQQDEMRRKQIRIIMSDDNLSSVEKSRAVQNLMNAGRRSSMASTQTASVASTTHDGTTINNNFGNSSQSGFSYVSNMAQVARQAAEYYSSDDDGEGDAVMSDYDDNSSNYDSDEHHHPFHNSSQHPDDVLYNDYRSVASSVTHVTPCCARGR